MPNLGPSATTATATPRVSAMVGSTSRRLYGGVRDAGVVFIRHRLKTGDTAGHLEIGSNVAREADIAPDLRHFANGGGSAISGRCPIRPPSPYGRAPMAERDPLPTLTLLR